MILNDKIEEITENTNKLTQNSSDGIIMNFKITARCLSK